MDVFLVPTGDTDYQLYCEVATVAPEPDDPSPSLWGRMVASFRRALAEGEAESRRDPSVEVPERSRLRRFITRKLAEVVAEQRLLWHMRHETAADLVHPDSLEPARALEVMRASFDTDFGRHRRWLMIHGLFALVTGPLFFFVPGPNFIAWYFTFRAVGHYFSMRGARQATTCVAWTPRPSPHLTTVARALKLDADTRSRQVNEAAHALGLKSLAAFLDRVACGPA